MPTYEFRCPTGHEFEKFYRSISAAPPEVMCPTCGKIAARLMSAGGGLVFKGSGFYITDYGKDGKKPLTPPAASGEGATAGASGETAAAKGESPAKSETKPSGDAKSGSDPKPAASGKSASKTSSPGKAKSSE